MIETHDSQVALDMCLSNRRCDQCSDISLSSLNRSSFVFHFLRAGRGI